MFRFERIKIDRLSEEEIRSMYSLYTKLNDEYNILQAFRNAQEFKAIFLSIYEDEFNELYSVNNGKDCLGLISFTKVENSYNYEEYKLDYLIEKLYINDEMEKLIRSIMTEKLSIHRNILVVLYNSVFINLLEGYGPKIRANSNYYSLKKENIDVKMLESWDKELREKNSDLKMVFTNEISDKYIEQYCNLFTETMEDMPDNKDLAYTKYIINPEVQRGVNKRFKDNDITHYCYLIFNQKNELIAMSNMRISNKDPRYPYQFMIGVRREYRGRSLGKWLYSCMYKRLYENVDFEAAYVCHHPDNKYAINISESVGYKFSYLETIYLVSNS